MPCWHWQSTNIVCWSVWCPLFHCNLTWQTRGETLPTHTTSLREGWTRTQLTHKNWLCLRRLPVELCMSRLSFAGDLRSFTPCCDSSAFLLHQLVYDEPCQNNSICNAFVPDQPTTLQNTYVGISIATNRVWPSPLSTGAQPRYCCAPWHRNKFVAWHMQLHAVFPVSDPIAACCVFSAAHFLVQNSSRTCRTRGFWNWQNRRFYEFNCFSCSVFLSLFWLLLYSTSYGQSVRRKLAGEVV